MAQFITKQLTVWGTDKDSPGMAKCQASFNFSQEEKMRNWQTRHDKD